jgi:hypothetical protein
MLQLIQHLIKERIHMRSKKFVLPVPILCYGLLLFAFLPTAFGQDTPPPPPPPAHPATLAQIQKLVALTHAAERVKAAMHANIQTQKSQRPQILPPEFWAELEQEFDKIDWIKIATPVYQRYFSVDEADSVIAFYSTPIGQKVLESSTIMTQELSTQGFTIGKEIGERLGQKYQKEIQDNARKLQSEQSASPQ